MPSLPYSPERIVSLFDEMPKTYGAVNLISSFGFSHLWRKASVLSLDPMMNHRCADLMCGMGEASVLMLKAGGPSLNVDAVDFSPEMTKRCRKTVSRLKAGNISVHTRNIFDLPRVAVYDRICCSFGLKTLDEGQLAQFASLIRTLLRPAGKAAFVEIHVPEQRLFRDLYLFYIRHVIPSIGRLCLGNPDCYRYLARYTEDFAQRDCFADYLKEAGLKVTVRPLFFGCARLYFAELPELISPRGKGIVGADSPRH